MIWFYSGTNGSGKSLHAAKDIYDKLRTKPHKYGSEVVAKNNVITSFDLNLDAIPDRKGIHTQVGLYDLSPKWLDDYALAHHRLDLSPREGEHQTLVVLDEVQRIFNPRDFDRKDRRAWLDWFPEHRKLGYDFILISPFDKMVDRQIRCLFEYEVIHRKANNFGTLGAILTILGIESFSAIYYWYGNKQLDHVDTFKAKPQYFDMYNSFQRFNKQDKPAASAGADGGAASPVGGPATAPAIAEGGTPLLSSDTVA